MKKILVRARLLQKKIFWPITTLLDFSGPFYRAIKSKVIFIVKKEPKFFSIDSPIEI